MIDLVGVSPKEAKAFAAKFVPAHGPWTREEHVLLARGMAQIPGGAVDRWESIQERYLPKRTLDDIMKQVKRMR